VISIQDVLDSGIVVNSIVESDIQALLISFCFKDKIHICNTESVEFCSPFDPVGTIKYALCDDVGDQANFLI
jgi:hypothetical protein